MAIADSTLRHDVFTTVRSTLSTMSLSPSPTLSASFPDNEPGFPLLVIRPILVDITKTTMPTTSSGLKWKTIKVMLEIYSKDNSDLDTIADGIYANGGMTSISGLQFVSSDDNVALSNVQNLQKVRLRTLSFVYRWIQ